MRKFAVMGRIPSWRNFALDSNPKSVIGKGGESELTENLNASRLHPAVLAFQRLVVQSLQLQLRDSAIEWSACQWN
jgi:hypothetical protein